MLIFNNNIKKNEELNLNINFQQKSEAFVTFVLKHNIPTG